MKKIESIKDLKVGKRYRGPTWGKNDWVEVLFIGDRRAFVKAESGEETSYEYVADWVELPEETMVKAWPAMVKSWSHQKRVVIITDQLFLTEEQASEQWGNDLLLWPAIPGPDGSYEVPKQ